MFESHWMSFHSSLVSDLNKLVRLLKVNGNLVRHFSTVTIFIFHSPLTFKKRKTDSYLFCAGTTTSTDTTYSQGDYAHREDKSIDFNSFI